MQAPSLCPNRGNAQALEVTVNTGYAFFPFLCRVVRGSKLLLFGGGSDDEQGSKEDDYRRGKFHRMSFLKSCCEPRKSQTSLILGPCLRSAFTFLNPGLQCQPTRTSRSSITARSASCEGRFGDAHKLDDVRSPPSTRSDCGLLTALAARRRGFQKRGKKRTLYPPRIGHRSSSEAVVDTPFLLLGFRCEAYVLEEIPG